MTRQAVRERKLSYERGNVNRDRKTKTVILGTRFIINLDDLLPSKLSDHLRGTS